MQQKSGLSKRTSFIGKGYNTNRNGTTNNSRYPKGSERHPYLKPEFWNNPSNQFWNSDMYSEKSKEYFNNTLLEK